MIEGYTVVRSLRASETAPVFVATSPDGTEVVVKSMSIGAEASTAMRMQERFDVVSSIEHPGIPAYRELRIDDRTATWVHDFVPGETVQSWIDAGKRFTEAEVFDFLAEILEVMAVMEEHGLIHRDLKPENIVATPDGRLVLIDFAGANVWDASGNVSVLGTTGYAAPEQLVGDAVFASDQYGLAATALHLATGRHPTEFPLRNLRIEIEEAGLSKGLEDTLEKMLAPDPDDRYADAREALVGVRDLGARPPWEWPLMELEQFEQPVVSFESESGALTIHVGVRPRKRALAVATLFALLAFGVVGFITWKTGFVMFFAMSPFLAMVLALYWTEIARRRHFDLRLSELDWSISEKGPFRRLEVSGSGVLTATAYQSQVFRQRDDLHALRLRSPSKTWLVGRQMFPLEARRVAEAIATYQSAKMPLIEGGGEVTEEASLVPNKPAQLAIYEARATPIRWVHSLHGRHRAISDEAADRIESELRSEFRVKVASLGLTKLGGGREAHYFGLVRHEHVHYVTPDHLTRLAVRPGGRPGGEPGVTYYLISTLEDRRQIITWSHVQVSTRSSKRLISTPTSGSLAADLRTHRRLLVEEMRGQSALAVHDITDSVAMTRMYDRYSVSNMLALLLMTPLLYAAMMIAALVLMLLR